MPGTENLEQLTMVGQLSITDALAAVDELAVRHTAPDKAEEICWVRDVRRHGLEAANRLHPSDAR